MTHTILALLLCRSLRQGKVCKRTREDKTDKTIGGNRHTWLASLRGTQDRIERIKQTDKSFRNDETSERDKQERQATISPARQTSTRHKQDIEEGENSTACQGARQDRYTDRHADKALPGKSETRQIY
jgi:hypothetical protein